MDTFSRKIVGWSMDMAIKNRRPAAGGIVHADHGVQFTSWSFGEKVRSAGLMPSFGTVGDGLDNAMIESFWSSMQTELLNRQRWRTRVELANAMFDYIEILHDRRRRHSQPGYRTPIEHELAFAAPSVPA
jgi:transposase InsO family protein